VTRTEDRLADALAAVARGVREETLPPLPGRSPSPQRQRWARWLAPAAAAASVVLVVVLISAIHLFSGKPSGGPAQAAGPPRYYAAAVGFAIQIHRTATGALIETVPNPYSGHGDLGMMAQAVAAADGGREFIVAYSGTTRPPPQPAPEETRLYEFRLDSAGHASRLSPVKGGVITGLDAQGVMAVSPDGSRVALALAAPVRPGVNPKPPEIVVIGLTTGARSVWSGGMNLPGMALSIPSISWGPGRDNLVFLAQWCRNGAAGGFCFAGRHITQVSLLHVTVTGGGRLSSSAVLLMVSVRYSNIAQALLSPGGKTVTMVVLHGTDTGSAGSRPYSFQVVQVPYASGRGSRLLYRGSVGTHTQVILGSDATGRYLLLAWGRNGWLDHGVLRPLAPQGGTALEEAW
jgi:hypothetical protein